MNNLAAVVIGALLVAAPTAVSAQNTLRSILPAAAIGAIEKADLDRPLTSSGYGSSPTAFVVAYYFVDESDRGGLGPLHVGRFDYRTRTWRTIVPQTERLGGSVNSVDVTATHALLDLHANPSSGEGLVFALDTLELVADVWGSPQADLS